MLTPEYLNSLPDAAVELSRQIEDDLLRDAARRIAKMDTITSTAAYQLFVRQESTAYRRSVLKALAELTGKSEAVLRDLFLRAGEQTLADEDAIHIAAGGDPLPLERDTSLQHILTSGLLQTQKTFRNLTQTTVSKGGNRYMPHSAVQQFKDLLDRAWYQVSSGGFSYDYAIRRAVNDLASSGIAAITYPTRHVDTIEVATRRAVLTGVNQTAAKLQLARAGEMDCEFVEVTAHGGARPEHALWQGQVYHIGGAVTLNGEEYRDFAVATGYGTGPGLCGWNCRHNFHPFYPGLSRRNYDDKALTALNAKNIEYNGKKYTQYEIDQMQRAGERNVRKLKRQVLVEDAAGLPTGNSAVRLKQAREKLAEFCRDTGNRMDGGRIGVGGFGRSEASKASWAARKVEIEAQAAYNRAVKDVRAKIAAADKTINVGHQGKHILSSPGYIEGRSYLYGDLETAQALISKYSGTGDPGRTCSGDWNNKEVIVAAEDIGIDIDKDTGVKSTTNRATIHYGKNGTHIVPAKRSKKS